MPMTTSNLTGGSKRSTPPLSEFGLNNRGFSSQYACAHWFDRSCGNLQVSCGRCYRNFVVSVVFLPFGVVVQKRNYTRGFQGDLFHE